MMERRFSMNDFEHSLKEHADDFKMIPSKRVWHGIYNDMHPGRRWPSVTMSLLLVFTLVVIGHLNTHNGYITVNSKDHSLQPNTVASNLNSGESSNTNQKIALPKKASRIVNSNTLAESQQKGVASQEPKNPDTRLLQNKTGGLTSDDLVTQNSKATIQSEFTGFERNENSTPQVAAKSNNNINGKIFDYNNIQLQNNSNSANSVKLDGTIKEKITVDIENNLQSDRQIAIENVKVIATKVASDIKNVQDIEQKKPNDLGKKLSRKKNDKINWVYFLAPQVNSVSFNGQPIRPLNNNNSPAVAINAGNYKVLHNSALGFEAGIQVNNSLTRKLWITSGIHITYSGYNITSNEVHPTFANLLLKDPATGDVYSKSYITHYGNGTGQTVVSVRNYSLQGSLPFGLQYEFAGSDKIKFNTYANFEPSLVIKSNAYILSSDGNNYINDPDLLRKFNMNSNFGAFITFNSAKYKWQIGPNVRYQWLSTYKKDYPIQEHLIDYGIRIGISPLRK
jgi:hypothetical protein